MGQTQAKFEDETIDPAFVQEFTKRFLDACNSHDVDAVLALLTQDVVYDDSTWPRTMRGHPDVREFLQHTWGAFPDLHLEVVDGPFVMGGKPDAAFYLKGHGTHTGAIDPPGVAPTGKRIEIEAGMFEHYRGGKLCRLRMVLDMADLMRQLGLMPEQWSREERALAAAQRLGSAARRLVGR